MPARQALTTIAPTPELPLVPLYRGNLEEDLRLGSRNQLAESVTGGLSVPGKMPCPSWGIPATRCRIGSVLAEQKGSVCSACYALKNRYRFSAVQAKLEHRYAGLFHELWTPAMLFFVRYFCDEYFRLFDSGDMQDSHNLKNIVTLARHVPDVKMWLPTREVETVRLAQRELEEFPENLLVRVSANMIDGKPPTGFEHTSTVIASEPSRDYLFPALPQGYACRECRACWVRRCKTSSIGCTDPPSTTLSNLNMPYVG